ncbi:MerR family transcriptional regulator [Flavilitoribacter nigricans]|uniref:MerR family transcriptional regulator n=1 Tax=Flavilitoribacter nigricans (strain ATCC 23147 / DSM 23189 / NBRC 102662 / NCIMB 1420 / SS-2) TaxID=1122177 RepID=A0A2D0N9R2_FLAN2|nr:MerR family transcriptional regulator [Flavilitoribacter nigricans]PHN05217.1 MerR family transcriptional regulator [Flavilitoribacter nigricans DSM 23189 = NBRC 102662]
MASYSVKQLAKLSGVSVRTLHHYDKIGLLRPAERTEARYRRYEAPELLRLQQILFYRELGFPLREIGEILDDPTFDLLEALESHKVNLRARKHRIDQLLTTLDHTIDQIKKGNVMEKPEELYEGLHPDTAKEYREGAIKKYGKKEVERSERALMKMGKDGFAALQAEAKENTATLFRLMDRPPESAVVQAEIARHYRIIRQFWGTANSDDPQAEAYAGLGQLYVNDERFTMVGGQPQPEFAQFLSRAMAHYAKHSLS